VPTDAEVFHAPGQLLQLVAEPVRWSLLLELRDGDRRVGELCELTRRPQNLVSYHLRQLRQAGLVQARRSSADGRDTYYRLESPRFARLLEDAGRAVVPGLRLARERTGAPPRPTRPAQVLFLCTGNSARSQMAEAIVNATSQGRVRARSAGSHPKQLHPNAVRVMAERGIDVSACRAKHLRRFTRTRFDRVITLCDRVREVCPDFAHHPATGHWSMSDPSGEGDTHDATYPAFCRTAEELDWRIELLLAQLTDQPDQPEEDLP
jgi:protein-tyrosine-phosphatase/DNA-binding transcriptional ArsR family regulator